MPDVGTTFLSRIMEGRAGPAFPSLRASVAARVERHESFLLRLAPFERPVWWLPRPWLRLLPCLRRPPRQAAGDGSQSPRSLAARLGEHGGADGGVALEAEIAVTPNAAAAAIARVCAAVHPRLGSWYLRFAFTRAFAASVAFGTVYTCLILALKATEPAAGALSLAVLAVNAVCGLAMLDARILRAVLRQFDAVYLLWNVLLFCTMGMLGQLDDDTPSRLRAGSARELLSLDLLTVAAFVGFGIFLTYFVLWDAVVSPQLQRPLVYAFSAALCLLSSGSTLLRERFVGTEYGDRRICLIYCARVRTLALGAQTNVLIFVLKLVLAAARRPRKLTFRAADVLHFGVARSLVDLPGPPPHPAAATGPAAGASPPAAGMNAESREGPTVSPASTPVAAAAAAAGRRPHSHQRFVAVLPQSLARGDAVLRALRAAPLPRAPAPEALSSASSPPASALANGSGAELELAVWPRVPLVQWPRARALLRHRLFPLWAGAAALFFVVADWSNGLRVPAVAALVATNAAALAAVHVAAFDRTLLMLLLQQFTPYFVQVSALVYALVGAAAGVRAGTQEDAAGAACAAVTHSVVVLLFFPLVILLDAMDLRRGARVGATVLCLVVAVGVYVREAVAPRLSAPRGDDDLCLVFCGTYAAVALGALFTVSVFIVRQLWVAVCGGGSLAYVHVRPLLALAASARKPTAMSTVVAAGDLDALMDARRPSPTQVNWADVARATATSGIHRKNASGTCAGLTERDGTSRVAQDGEIEMVEGQLAAAGSAPCYEADAARASEEAAAGRADCDEAGNSALPPGWLQFLVAADDGTHVPYFVHVSELAPRHCTLAHLWPVQTASGRSVWEAPSADTPGTLAGAASQEV